MARLVVITGPSGVGKGTLIKLLLGSVQGLVESISATTRPPREGEIDGREYHFLSETEFADRRDRGEFLEWANYAGHSYGTLLSEVERNDDARGVVLEIETLGARQVRSADPSAVMIFIAPPDARTLESRLRSRATDSPEQIALRLAQAREEMLAQDEFDTVVINDELTAASRRLAIEVERRLS
jgi:guanylate kinase